MGTMRVGTVGVDDNLRGRLLRAANGIRLEACGDPVRFARDATIDKTAPRALIVSLGEEPVWPLLEELARHAGGCPVVALHHGDDARQLRAIALGVRGVVSREASPERILRAVAATVDGDGVVSQHTLAAFARLLPAQQAGADTLTAQERRWLNWLAEGLTVQQIADEAGWSARQMRRRLSGLYLRLGVTNRDQAVSLAGRLGLPDGHTSGG